MARILIVDDEANMRRILAAILTDDGHEVEEAAGLSAARAAVAAARFDVVITDQRMPDGEGLDLLDACREADPALPVVLVTAFATVELAVEAMRRGAFDVVTKPFMPGPVRAVVRRACERTALVRENERLRGEVRHLAATGEILGRSAAIEAVRDLVRRVAPTEATVLVTGETGTGKELVARAIHAASLRADGPFVAVNCAAFTETLLESELFGHEKGAFTGAERSRQGLFETAHGGTLFLDEGGEMSLPLQARLLRVLVDGEITRVGASTPRRVDVRIVVATHRDLEAMVAEGAFRQDLFYRLAVVPVAVPPLRERRDDIPLLAERFLAAAARDLKVPERRLSADAVARLSAYAYPGNVRELRNLVERACILARGDVIGPDDLPPLESAAGAGDDPLRRWLAGLPPGIDLRHELADIEAALIRRALDAAGGIQAEAARRLGLSRSDLAYKIKRLGVK